MNLLTDFSSGEAEQVEACANDVGLVNDLIKINYVYFKNSHDSNPKPMEMDWPEFVRRFSRHHERAAKDGLAWSPVTYLKGAQRGNSGVQAVHLAVLDIDDGIPAEKIAEYLQGYAALIHSSWSHTAEVPKYRVIVPLLEPIQASDWSDGWNRINALIHGHNDPATKDPARIFYGPSRPKGSQDHFVKLIDGKPLSIQLLPPALPSLKIPTTVVTPSRQGIRRVTETPSETYNPELNEVVFRCQFMKDVSAKENQASVSEPLWQAMISNACRFDSDEWIHEASCHHPGYDEMATDRKIQRALKGSAPVTCNRIRELGYEGCPSGGCSLPSKRTTGAPAGLATWFRIKDQPTESALILQFPAPQEGAESFDLALTAKADDENLGTNETLDSSSELTAELPSGYQIHEGQLSTVKFKDGEPYTVPICSPLYVTALTRDENNSNWGRLLEFADPDGNEHSWSMPQEMLSGNGEAYRSVLLNMGLGIVPQSSKLLGEYIAQCNPKQRALCVSQIGWHGSVFVLPDATYGASTQRVILQTTERNSHTYGQKGTLEEWKANVSTLCVGNTRLMLGVSAAFAAPLLKLLDEESGGIHFRGESSKGKTKILKVASSVWGGNNNMQRWKATGNGLEAIAQNYNHTLLCLDELAQVSPKEAGEIAYMLANGAGKQRASRTGAAKERATWRLLFLSAGEIGLAEHMSQDSQRIRAGQQVRMADVPVDAGVGLGAFENLHGHLDGSRFANVLTEMSGMFYGTAGRSFVQWLVQLPDLQAFVDGVNRDIQAFIQANVSGTADGQVFRVGRRFGLIGVAGELAIEAGVVNWQSGSALAAAARCLEDWIDARQGTGSQEETAILAQIRRFFEAHGESRFAKFDDHGQGNPQRTDDRTTINRAGFRKLLDGGGEEFYVYRQTYRDDVCHGFDPRQVTKVLVQRGLLRVTSDGKSQVLVRLPDSEKPTRMYCFKPEILAG